jgi:hypothetical protein
MSIHNPENAQELIEYVKRKLGEDKNDEATLTVDITDDQAMDCVQDAIRIWSNYALDGTITVAMEINVIPGKIFYKLPDQIYAVHGFYNANDMRNIFSLDWQLKTTIGNNLRFFQGDILTTIEITREYLSLLDLKLGKKYDYEYNSTTKMLNIIASPNCCGRMCVIASAFADQSPSLFNNQWILRYTEYLFLKQWGMNFRQFKGVKMPGGVEIDYESMITDANVHLKELEEELYTHWARPVRFKRG